MDVIQMKDEIVKCVIHASTFHLPTPPPQKEEEKQAVNIVVDQIGSYGGPSHPLLRGLRYYGCLALHTERIRYRLQSADGSSIFSW